MHNISFLNSCFYSWAYPIVQYANKHGTIRLSSIGTIPENKKCDQEAEKIKKSFLKKSGNPDDDLLAWAAISCYFWFYLYYIMW